jgi:predicted transposase YdaD
MEVWKMMYPTADEVYERAGIAAHYEKRGEKRGMECGIERGREMERQNTLALQRQLEAAQRQIQQLKASANR